MARSCQELSDPADSREVLSEHVCLDPETGATLNSVNISFFLNMLNMKEEYFVRLYPDSDLSQSDRSRLSDELTTHLMSCVRCSAKHKLDTEHRRQVDQLFDDHKAEFGSVLAKTAGR